MIDQDTPIAELMTTSPVVAAREQALSDARDLMSRNRVRHLPVLDDKGAPVGLVSARDVMWVEDLGVYASYDTAVQDIMSRKLVAAAPTDSLSSVIKKMYSLEVGAVLVVESGKLVGIFTDVDVVTVLARMFKLD